METHENKGNNFVIFSLILLGSLIFIYVWLEDIIQGLLFILFLITLTINILALTLGILRRKSALFE
jgi:hypothetical protein